MLLYEYPDKKDIAAQRRQMAMTAAKRKKLRTKSIVIYIMSAAVFLLGLTAEGIFAKVAICFLAVVSAALNVVTAQLASMSDPKEKTKVYDDGFTHETKSFLGKKRAFDIRFEDVLKTVQSSSGDLVITLKSGDILTVPFVVTKTKLFLLNELHEQLKYDKKQYNVITDDDEYEEKDWVDRL